MLSAELPNIRSLVTSCKETGRGQGQGQGLSQQPIKAMFTSGNEGAAYSLCSDEIVYTANTVSEICDFSLAESSLGM